MPFQGLTPPAALKCRYAVSACQARITEWQCCKWEGAKTLRFVVNAKGWHPTFAPPLAATDAGARGIFFISQDAPGLSGEFARCLSHLGRGCWASVAFFRQRIIESLWIANTCLPIRSSLTKRLSKDARRLPPLIPAFGLHSSPISSRAWSSSSAKASVAADSRI